MEMGTISILRDFIGIVLSFLLLIAWLGFCFRIK